MRAGMGEEARVSEQGAERRQRALCSSWVLTLSPAGNPNSALGVQPLDCSCTGLWRRSFYPYRPAPSCVAGQQTPRRTAAT